jgi:hypothetical protein
MKQTIQSYKLSITWDDGKTEGLGIHLPEYLENELKIYFQELEDLREEYDNGMRDEDYHFSTDEEKSI